MKLIGYNFVFIVPLVLLYIISYYIGNILSPTLKVSPEITAEILMIVFSLILFFILIPLIRIRETIQGIRFALFNFIIVGFVITIPSVIQGNYDVLMLALIILANFIFATFINSPDVIGISGDPDDWFKHKVQIMIFLIYVSIVLLYIFGYSWMYFQLATDQAYPGAFRYGATEIPNFPTFLYYSVVTMSTVGYGDITPASPGARLVMSTQTLVGMIINVVFIAILMMYVSFTAGSMERKMENKLQKDERILEQETKHIAQEEARIEREQKRLEDLEKQYPNYLNGRNNMR